MSSRVQPANLKERIAAIEQRNNASQRQRPLSPPPTTSTGSSFLTPQTTGSGGGGALKEKIARFEKKGGVPVPRGSFGLGAPPPVEKGPIKRRGELYGNRIPSAARSHTTGPQLSSGGISTHLTGPSPPSRSEARHSHSFALDGNGKIPGLEYDENSEDTGGFEPPDSSLGQPQQFLSYTSASRTSSPVPPVPSLSDPPRPERVAKAERRVASDSVRRGIAFATALELARKVESDQQAVYDPRSRETSLSPNLTGSSRQNSPPIGVDDVSQNVQQTAPSIVVSTGEAEEVGPDLILEDDKVTGYDDDREHIQAQIQQEEPTLPLPISSSEVESEHPETESLETSQSSNLQSQPVSISSIAPDAGDSSSITFDAPVNEPVTNPKVVDEVLPNSAVHHVNASVDVEPPALPPAVPVPAESETKSSDELSQEIALSETHVAVLTSLEQLPVETAGATNISGDESDSGASSESTIQDTRVLKEADEDDDSDLFVRPIKRRSPMNNSFEDRSSLAQSSGDSLDNDVSPVASPKDTLPDPTRLAPSTPSKAATGSMIHSEDSQTSSELPTARDSYISQTSQTSQTVTIASRPASMMDSSSPGHVLFAQRISPATSRGVPIFIPASSERQTTDSSTPSTVEPLYIQKRSDNDIPEEDTGISEFGTVTVGGGSSTLRPSHSRGYTEPEYEKINNRVSTFSAVVHRKVRETQTLPESSKKAPSTPSKKKPATVAEPMSPGFSELSMLMQQSVLLESRLLIGDYPDESGAKREVVGRGTNEKGREREREREREHPEEAMKLKRTNSGKSGKSHDSEGKKRKLSLKRTFGIGKNARREGVPPMESIPASPPPPGVSVKDISRSKSMDTLRSSQSATVPPLPSFSLEPPPLPKPGKARSIHALSTEPKHTDSSASASSTTGPGRDSDDIPPTPPPKSPPGKYLSSIRRFASSSRSHAGAYPRHSVSNSSELSSDDSVTVVTPPDYSPNLAGSRTLLETRTRTRSGSRSGKTILIGAGTPPPGIADEDGASVFTTGSGSVKWPSSSPKKSGGMSRAASFAEKMFSRSRTKSNTSSTSTYDFLDRYATGEQPMSRAHPPSSMPILPHDVPSPSPSLHELILSEPVSLTIPEMNEPQPSDSKLARPPSWLSTSSAGTGSSSGYSRLLDKDFFDSFPPVPETLPPSHTRANSQNTIRTLSRPH